MKIATIPNKRRRAPLLEAFTCHVWCKEPLYLKTGAGRNRFNLLVCVDPCSLDIMQAHSMIYADAYQTKSFLEKVRLVSGDAPVSIVLDNARYQNCQTVKDKAAELGIDFIFLHPYSPNLNIIERLWKYQDAMSWLKILRFSNQVS